VHSSASRPYQLRHLLEREVRSAFDEARAEGQAIDPLLLIGSVLGRHQHRADVNRRLEFFWSYLEAYLVLLDVLSREPRD
jgi:hypothetical protein